MRQGDEVYYLHGDHLGSVSLVTDSNGEVVSRALYSPYGRLHEGSIGPTDFGFTAQRQEMGFGLYDYNARFYSPMLGRFISPDTIVPNPLNPQLFNRYSYAGNNPLKYRDPSGHWLDTVLDAAFITYDIYAIQQEGWTPLNTAALAVDVTLAFVPIATGGGPGLRLAFAGGETLSQAAIHLPAEIGALQGVVKFSQLIDSSSARPRQSGGRSRGQLEPDDFEGAERYYEEIRNTSKDIKDISKNTGFDFDIIDAIKRHIFQDEHLLDRYGSPEIRRFDADPEIANAWERLRTNNYTSNDIQLLKHEYVEGQFMEQGYGYSNAHDMATKLAPWQP